MNLTSFDIEFFSISTLLKDVENKEQLRKILIKLNNPTYYSRFIEAHPMHKFGYYTKKTINPIIIAINSMLNILKTEPYEQPQLELLQKEYAWAFNACSAANTSIKSHS
jgi:hypothetical protein